MHRCRPHIPKRLSTQFRASIHPRAGVCPDIYPILPKGPRQQAPDVQVELSTYEIEHSSIRNAQMDRVPGHLVSDLEHLGSR